MRCMACGAEMRVVQVVPDETLEVPGYEHHTLQCSGCNDVEQRLVFNRAGTARAAAEPVAESVAPPIPPPAVAATDAPIADEPIVTAPIANERIAGLSAWKRAVARFRGRHAGQR
jgi:hypothetical protein